MGMVCDMVVACVGTRVLQDEECRAGACLVGRVHVSESSSHSRTHVGAWGVASAPVQGGEAGGSGGGTQGLTGGTGTYGTVSQFQLLEESGPGGPTQPEGGAAAAMNHSTMALIGWVLWRLWYRASGHSLSRSQERGRAASSV